MKFKFSLCPACRDKYRALRYDPTCKFSLNVIPLCSLTWPDEHPGGFPCRCRDKCRVSIMRMADARTQLWRNGEIPADYLDLWIQAQAVIPEWPGFNRLVLDEGQLECLDACAAELEDMLGAIATLCPRAEFSEEGGGVVRLVAKRSPEQRAAKRWWQVRK